MAIGFPTTGSRLIGSIGYFLEPIILTFLLLNTGYSNSYIVCEYGILNGYVMPVLLLPSFFTMAISQALLPVVSNSYSRGERHYTTNKIKQAIIFSLIIGIPATLFFMLFPQIPLNFMYNTNTGITYLKVLAPICLLHYIQAPLTSSLQAMGKAKCAMSGTLGGMIVRTIVLIIGSVIKIGLWGLVLATTANIVYITIHHSIYVKRFLTT
jgi:stage V sporulation protein B